MTKNKAPEESLKRKMDLDFVGALKTTHCRHSLRIPEDI